MKTRKLLPFLLLAVALVFTMCEKDDEETKLDYEGTWIAEIEELQPNMPGKMIFTIAESSFVTDVKIVANNLEIPVMGIKGDIAQKNAETLTINLTDIGQASQSGGYNYVNRETDSTTFAAVHEELVAVFMPMDFDAAYSVVGDTLSLTIGDEIVKLHK
jgi:hypothetical protein